MPPGETVCGLIAQPHAGQRNTPPDNAQNRRPAFEPLVVFDRVAGGVHPLARYPGVRDRHSDPLAAGLLRLLVALTVHPLRP
jgi:hypothetical protein